MVMIYMGCCNAVQIGYKKYLIQWITLRSHELFTIWRADWETGMKLYPANVKYLYTVERLLNRLVY